MTAREQALKQFFDTVLKGESKTYNDHNWYVTGSSLRSYIEGRNQSPYPLLRKPLSQYTIGEIMVYQSQARDNTGQLWATGRYQIIPNTLKGVVTQAGLSKNDLYNQENQDKLAWQLLMNRRAIRSYLGGAVPDTTENLQLASLEMAKIWSSIGVPYAVQGNKRAVSKDESYYSGGGDRASVSSESVMAVLRDLRNKIGKGTFFLTSTAREYPKTTGLIVLLIVTALTGLIVYRKQIISKFNKK